MNLDDHLTKSAGYFDLKMWQDAWDELGKIEDQVDPQVLVLRVMILQGMEQWVKGATMAREAITTFPRAGRLYLVGAYHIRRAESVAAALEFLQKGSLYLVDDPQFWFTIACYQNQCGMPEKAKRSVNKAVILDDDFREKIGAEPDLDGIEI